MIFHVDIYYFYFILIIQSAKIFLGFPILLLRIYDVWNNLLVYLNFHCSNDLCISLPPWSPFTTSSVGSAVLCVLASAYVVLLQIFLTSLLIIRDSLIPLMGRLYFHSCVTSIGLVVLVFLERARCLANTLWRDLFKYTHFSFFQPSMVLNSSAFSQHTCELKMGQVSKRCLIDTTCSIDSRWWHCSPCWIRLELFLIRRWSQILLWLHHTTFHRDIL